MGNWFLRFIKKKDIFDLYIKYNIEYLDIPMTDDRHQFIDDNKTVFEEITDDQNCRLSFDAKDMIGRSTTTNPFIQKHLRS